MFQFEAAATPLGCFATAPAREGPAAFSYCEFAMAWSRKLNTRIDLSDGCRLATLSQVAARMLALPDGRFRSAHWGEAVELLRAAADDDATEELLIEAEAQLAIAFEIEGLLQPSAGTGECVALEDSLLENPRGFRINAVWDIGL